MKRVFYLLSIFLLISCGNSKNSPEFIEAAEGRYLFNSDETLDVHFVDGKMNVKWRGQDMVPIKAGDNSFYLKEMNEKLIFVSEPEMHIELAPKREHDGEKFSFLKLAKGEKTPNEYFRNKEYEKALQGYLAIQKRDSLDRTIREWSMNQLGYHYMRENKMEDAKAIFKINIALYPKSSNTYDSMGDAYRKEKDTVKAIEYYKKALAINPENRSSKRQLQKLTKE
ncbi:tetratricopeptide repeat protein [Pseudotenacibaculum haliotis]|uniref:Tetratricopeptide repeat protein n=1 Tax=Pseudotenacibaculum haliotis TaxID=1862138 RepID=A0ABW5LLQ0_9FLAO